MKHLKGETIKIICEVGARYGDESIFLSKVFKNSTVFSFECNPHTVKICEERLANNPNIKFFAHGLGEFEQLIPFYSYHYGNDGASSLFKRIDYDISQHHSGDVLLKQLSSVLNDEKIEEVDLLCMDVQGYELNVLKGCGEFLKKINYIIMEEPKPIINTVYLPENVHSKYIGAPNSAEIKEFMTNNLFIEIERIGENEIEDNVLYKRIVNSQNLDPEVV